MKTCNDCKYGKTPKSAVHLLECELEEDPKTNKKAVFLKVDPACSRFKPKDVKDGTGK